MKHLPSYSQSYALGHRYIMDIFDNEVEITEKIDGSQFSFFINENREFICRSRGQEINMNNPEKMFKIAIQQAEIIKDNLYPNIIFRCEYLSKPKHNVICYERVPINNLIIFNIEDNLNPLSYDQMSEIATDLGFECVPLLYQGKINNIEEIKELLYKDSILGNSKVEGIVVKNYNKYTPDNKYYVGKLVREDFKERLNKEWKVSNSTQGDIIVKLTQELKTESRYLKAIQHLKENGEWLGEPKDIGNLMKEIYNDIEKEEIDYIAQEFTKWALPQIKRGVTAGFAEFYKNWLLEQINIK